MAANSFTPTDWVNNSYAINTNADRQRDASNIIRNGIVSHRRNVDLNSRRNELNNTKRLSVRVKELQEKIAALSSMKTEIIAEISRSDQHKNSLEANLELLQILNDANTECKVLRQRRYGIDYVEDGVHGALLKESGVLENSRRTVQSAIQQTFSNILLLQEQLDEISKDLDDKETASAIDSEQYSLTPQSTTISYKPNSTMIPNGANTPYEWSNNTNYNICRAQNTIDQSRREYRENQINSDELRHEFESAKEESDDQLKIRRKDYIKAVNDLEAKEKQTKDEIAKLLEELDRLEVQINVQGPFQKLVQTRLENRKERPRKDQTRDAPMYGLLDENAQLNASRASLLERQREGRQVLASLNNELKVIQRDLATKRKSLEIENQCIDVRHQKINQTLASASPTSVESGAEGDSLPATFGTLGLTPDGSPSEEQYC